jgi:hypothetical protein
MASVTSRVARAVSCAIQRFSVSFACVASKSGGSAQPFISAKRQAFHSLVAKLR